MTAGPVLCYEKNVRDFGGPVVRLHASSEGEMGPMIPGQEVTSCMPKAWQKRKQTFNFRRELSQKINSKGRCPGG